MHWIGRHWKQMVLQIVLAAGGVAIAAPILSVASTALKSPGDYVADPAGLIPHHPTLRNFQEFFAATDAGRLMTNTAIAVVFSTIGTVLSSAVVAYPLARMRFRGRTAVFLGVLASIMLPPQVLLIPQYILFVKLGWVDTLLPLTVPSYFAVSGVFIFFLRQVFRSVPRELDEAVLIDGGNYWTVFWRVIVPVCRVPMLIVGVLQAVGSYNDYFSAAVYLHTDTNMTMALGLPLAGQSVSGVTGGAIIAAGTMLYVLPIVVLFLIVQRWFARGITLGGAIKQ